MAALATDRVIGVAVAASCALCLLSRSARAGPADRPASGAPSLASIDEARLDGPQIRVSLPEPSGDHPDEDRGTDGEHWHPRREIRFGLADHVVTGLAAGVVVGSAVARPRADHWRGGVLFDEDARDVLRVRSMYGRYAVRDASDVGVSLLSTWPFLVDALITAWWYRGRADLARDMALVAAEAFAVAAAVQGVANNIGSRERPYGRLCGKEIPEDSVDCEGSVRYRSFFSGHTTLSFVSAGLLCTNHLGLGLLGSAGDMATCVGGFVVASMTSAFRIMSDMHYASDVAVGALVGSAAGLAVPLLHLGRAKGDTSAHDVELRVGPVGNGLGVMGTF